MNLPVVIDFETKHTFRDFPKPAQLGISVAGAYDFNTKKGHVFREHELEGLYRLIENASYVIGFNIIDFDLPVLEAYYPGDISQFPTFDIMNDIKDKLGKRLSLDSLIKATIGKHKTGHGLRAVELYKEEKWEELSQYCLDDVMLTKELLEYGIEHGEIYYLSMTGKSPIKVRWEKYLEPTANKKDLHVTLPF